MQCPDSFTCTDLFKVPVIIALLIVTSVLERFELMPRITPPQPPKAPQ